MVALSPLIATHPYKKIPLFYTKPYHYCSTCSLGKYHCLGYLQKIATTYYCQRFELGYFKDVLTFKKRMHYRLLQTLLLTTTHILKGLWHACSNRIHWICRKHRASRFIPHSWNAIHFLSPNLFMHFLSLSQSDQKWQTCRCLPLYSIPLSLLLNCQYFFVWCNNNKNTAIACSLLFQLLKRVLCQSSQTSWQSV